MKHMFKFAVILLLAALIALFLLLPLKGDTGPRGYTGPRGEQGFTGLDGIQGEQGRQGPRGRQGFAGATGLMGADGNVGDPGVLFFSTISKQNTDTEKAAFVLCPDSSKVLYADSQVLYGGFSNPPWVLLDLSQSGMTTGFQGYAATYVNVNEESIDIPWSIQAYVICLHPDFVKLGETLEITDENDG